MPTRPSGRWYEGTGWSILAASGLDATSPLDPRFSSVCVASSFYYYYLSVVPCVLFFFPILFRFYFSPPPNGSCIPVRHANRTGPTGRQTLGVAGVGGDSSSAGKQGSGQIIVVYSRERCRLFCPRVGVRRGGRKRGLGATGGPLGGQWRRPSQGSTEVTASDDDTL